ncbi:MAG TPA: NAD(P)-binding domain-containing protein [Thermoanaerobaculia bacterium]|nr:NAD(P)-binding domain-containing protein [Thermoanaerobaculia bacterium]
MSFLSTLIWAAAATVAGGIVLAYWLAFRRRERQNRERADEAVKLGLSRPMGQYPFIDPAICIGCGACVRACPEKDVLGVVSGLAMVINGARCMGIGQCARACPVGAIELALGDLKSRADVPALDHQNQTNVPGLYVAGELGGLALIRNAVQQGRDTVRWVARDLAIHPGPKDPELLELAIVGAGPAGLSAALSAVECGLSYAVFEQQADLGGTIYNFPRRKLTHTQPVELPLYGLLRKDEYTKEELLELFGELVSRHRLAIRFGERVQQLLRDEDRFLLRTAKGLYLARRVLLAMGRRGTPRRLGVPGENLSKVMYQVRDADQYRHKKILCVGGGDSAVEAALGLARQPGNEVSLSYRQDGFYRIKRKNLDLLETSIERGRIRPILRSEVREIEAEKVRLATSSGELALANDYVFVLIGGEPPFPFLREAGVAFGGG